MVGKVRLVRITGLDCNLYRIPSPITLRDSIQEISHWEWVIVVLSTDAGITGTGFTYTLGVGGSAIRELLVTDIAPLVIGQAAYDVAGIWRRCWLRLHADGPGGITTLALAPIDIAIHDALSKRSGVPLYEHLGATRREIPTYASGINLHLDQNDLLEQVRRFLDDGYRVIKIKVGREDRAEDVDRVAAVRRVVGNEVGLYLDANQAWAPEEAIIRSQLLERFQPRWIEEPCLADDLGAYVELRNGFRTPVAAGETWFTQYEFANVLRAEAIDIAQPDVARVGGFTPWMAISGLADTHGIAVAPHFLMELSIHGLCAIPNGEILENVEGGSMHELGIAVDPVDIRGGIAHPSDRPGHGIEIDEVRLRPYRIGAQDRSPIREGTDSPTGAPTPPAYR
jgi:L-alanine-DL-glutamate epimerase-like enolase superfamily enzyme